MRTARWWEPDLPGTALGALLMLLAAGPSLLPRTSLFQGLTSGLAFAAGYAIGVAVHALARQLARTDRRLHGRWWWAALGVVVAVASVPVGLAAVDAQTWLATREGQEAPTAADVAVAFGVTVALSLALVLLGKGLRMLTRVIGGAIASRTRLPRLAGLATGVLAVTLALGLIVTGGGWAFIVSYESDFDDYSRSPGSAAEPSGQYRSVGPDSALSWELAGHEGRNILAGGPSAAEIAAVTGRDAVEPVRIYAGMDEPGDWEQRAAAVVSELDRLGVAEREVLVVAGVTGSGWLEPQALSAVEYLHDGNTAIAAMQYTNAESWDSYLFHPGDYWESTQTLVGAVGEWWDALPADDRPELYLYGLSLGSRAVQDSFADAEAMRTWGDGVIVAGTPFGTEINATLTAARDAGSPVTVPVLDDGLEYRWFGSGMDIAETGGQWDSPRVLYLQHGNDPIVWVGPDIVWSPPEWLAEGQRSYDVHPDMRWFPVVTGIQSLFDTAVDLDGPDGVGHDYGIGMTDAWIAVSGDAGHSLETLDAIRLAVGGGELPFGGDV